MFARLGTGSCLAQADPYAVHLADCGGPHTDEVTSVEDITARFATIPTQEQVQSLSDRLCPAAGRLWTGGDDPRYIPGYLWRFDDGVPGQVVRRFVCTVALAGHSPFLGTLRAAAAG